jgi:DNA-binding HxlR family transcriptional regulator
MNDFLEQEIRQLQNEIGCGPADPTPLMILYELADGPRNIPQLAGALNVGETCVSTTLAHLHEHRMVTANCMGPAVQYRLTDRRLIEALNYLRAVLRDVLAYTY